MTLHLQTTAAPIIYADIINSQFNKSESHYVSLTDRLNNATKDVWLQSVVDDSMDVFRSNNPSLKKWSQLTFCRALSTTLDLIDIDVTLQRVLDIIHVCNLLEHFDPIKVMPICVYEDEHRPNRYVCWDGQHTAIILYIIANRILGIADLSKVEVPMVVYASNQKSDMRNCFITLNSSEGKKGLDHIDIVHQKIFGVRTDGSTNAEWRLTEQKYRYLENYKIFLTHDKFGDTKQPGAYSRLDEFIDHSYDQSVTEKFAKYFFKICRSGRPVQPKESWMLYDFFELCHRQKINVDDAYIKEVADALRITGTDFDSIMFYNRAKSSYQEWWRINKPNPDNSLLGISYNENRIGLTFLIEQLRKSLTKPLPKYNAFWDVDTKDLF